MSQFTQPFVLNAVSAPIIGGTPGFNQIAVQTTDLGVLSPYIFGIATEGGNSPGVNDYAPFANTNFQNTYKAQGFSQFRINAAGTTGDWYNNSTARNNWLSGVKKCFPTFATAPNDYTPGRFLQTFTLGGSEGGEQVSTGNVQAVANWFRGNGIENLVWEVYNEPNISASDYANLFNSTQATLKQINPNYWVGGPVVNFATNDSFFSVMASQCNPDFVSFHKYYDGVGDYVSPTTNSSEAPGTGSNQYQFVRQFFPNKPCYISEYNMTDTSSDSRMATVDGAVFASLFCGNFLQAAGPLAWGCAIWEQDANNDYKIVSNDGSTVYPQGHVLGKLSRTMGGEQRQVTRGSGVPGSLFAFASSTATSWAIWLTNTGGTINNLGIIGVTGSTYQIWTLAGSSPSVSNNQPLSTLTSPGITVPGTSVVVLSSVAT